MKDFFARLIDKSDLRNPANTLQVTKNRKIYFIIPLVIIVLACILGTVFQLVETIDGFANIGIDFQGGTVLTVNMTGQTPMLGENQATHEQMIEDVIEKHGFSIAIVQTSGNDALIVRYKNLRREATGVLKDYGSDELSSELNDFNNTIKDEVKLAFETKYPGSEVTVDSSLISSTAANDLIKKACLSVGIALIVIFIYIIFRFDFFSGICAIIALLHDIVMMLAFTVIFRVEMNSEYVAALITIVAYSINNTIMVFDRIRNLVKESKKSDIALNPFEIVDKGVTQTMSRTILTTITTMLVIISLIAISVASVRTFGLPILFGLVAGFFSSVFIAPALWAIMTNANNKRKANKEKYESTEDGGKVNPFKAFAEKVKERFQKPTTSKGKKKKKKKASKSANA